jgi:AcrR family transcriptional regulator
MTPSPDNQKRTYHHGNLRASLLSAVVDLARESGISAVTMRSVAARTGVSESAAYHHFRGKSDLLAAAAVNGFKLFAEYLETAVSARSSSGGDPAIGLAEGYVKFAAEDPGAYELIFGRHVVEEGIDQRDDAREAGGATIEIALNALSASLEHRGKKTPINEVFPMVRAVLHGVVELANEQEIQRDMSVDQMSAFATRTVDTLLNGLE